jgi:CO/xanthine dehydrogenase FAD-binding subunit
MRRFAYERPTTLAQATQLLAQAGDTARVLAGGTDLVVGLRDDSIRPSVVVDLKHIEELQGQPIVEDAGVIRFSALATMSQIEHSPLVLAELPALAEAARVVGSVQIRNRATLAGNVCNGSPAADTTPPQLVYGSMIVIAGPEGQRRAPIDEFMLGARRLGPDKRKVDLRPGELVTAIEIPVYEPPFGSAYTRLVRRRGTDLASITMAAAVAEDHSVGLAYGSVGPRPFLVWDESGVLGDPAADPERRDATLAQLLDQATPSPRSIRAGPDYRLAMLPVLAKRVIATAIERHAGRAA